MLCSKKPPVASTCSSKDGPSELRFEHNCDLTPVIFVGKTEGAEHMAVGCHSSMHTCADDASSTTRVWVVLCNKLLKDYYPKRAETSLHMKKSSPCRDGSMHECTG